MKKITKAIIPVAGWGTRRLPITKTIEKCMLPVGNRPIIDYLIQDCIKAGVTDFYIVVSPGSTQIKDYYTPNQRLNEYLKINGKEDRLPEILPKDKQINMHFIEQDPNDKYGTAIPVAMVADQIESDESVLVLMGDAFLYHKDGHNDIKKMVEQVGDDSALLGAKIPIEEVERYGVIDFDAENNFKQIVEKPKREDAPSNLINVAMHILNSAAINKIVDYSERDDVEGEYYITVPLNDYVKEGNKMKVVVADGQFLDGGSVEGWLNANQVVLGQ